MYSTSLRASTTSSNHSSMFPSAEQIKNSYQETQASFKTEERLKAATVEVYRLLHLESGKTFCFFLDISSMINVGLGLVHLYQSDHHEQVRVSPNHLGALSSTFKACTTCTYQLAHRVLCIPCMSSEVSLHHSSASCLTRFHALLHLLLQAPQLLQTTCSHQMHSMWYASH